MCICANLYVHTRVSHLAIPRPHAGGGSPGPSGVAAWVAVLQRLLAKPRRPFSFYTYNIFLSFGADCGSGRRHYLQTSAQICISTRQRQRRRRRRKRASLQGPWCSRMCCHWCWRWRGCRFTCRRMCLGGVGVGLGVHVVLALVLALALMLAWSLVTKSALASALAWVLVSGCRRSKSGRGNDTGQPPMGRPPKTGERP